MPPLVDYDSSSSSESEAESKRQKTTHNKQADATRPAVSLPPLPSTFHDLYASTVRVSTSDDPTLHQGRKRVNPHKVGNWPSHLYIEWHPSVEEQSLLSTLLDRVQTAIKDGQPWQGGTTPTPKISSFLTSDLGAPQPLHISLSRPVVLTTLQKDGFLEELTNAIRHGTKDPLPTRPRRGDDKASRDNVKTVTTPTIVRPFELAPSTLEWHRTPESERSFLVLRVRTRTAGNDNEGKTKPNNPSSPPKPATTAKRSSTRRKTRGDTAASATAEKQGEETSSSSHNTATPTTAKDNSKTSPTNPELTSLLQTCNSLLQNYDQPSLYAISSSPTTSSSTTATRDNAFHISLAWSFSEPEPWIREATESAFTSSNLRDTIQAQIRVPVDGIKAKIGNVVTHVGLPRMYFQEEEAGDGGGDGGKLSGEGGVISTTSSSRRRRSSGLKELY